MKKIPVPRVMISAPQSGSGKTTVVNGVLSLLRSRGESVQAFKVGPDYIDPGYHVIASGRPVHNLDTWLMSRESAAELFKKNAKEADISIIEGVMGLYDGGRGGISSSADIAKLTKTPVILVIDARSMGESAAAVAKGFRDYDRDVDVRGVILNRLGSQQHRQMICEAMEKINMPVLGAVFRDEKMGVPERHLGLLPSQENDALASVENIRAAIEKSVDIDALIEVAKSAPPLEFEERAVSRAAKKVKIGVAKDEAFSFYYPDSLEVLERNGAELIFFSPLKDEKIPDVDGLIFGGGFPEIFAKELSANKKFIASLLRAAENGMPIYAECGGFMYLTEHIADFNGEKIPMAGVIPLSCRMNQKLQTVGYVEAEALSDNILCAAGTTIRGHEFHFSSVEKESGSPAFRFRKHRTGAEYRAGYSYKNILASYLHFHFAGSPALARQFVDNCAHYKKS